MAKKRFEPPDAAALEALAASLSPSPAAVVLRLAWNAGLTRSEICGLTWAQVDFSAMALRLPDRSVPLDAAAAELLRVRQRHSGRLQACVAVSDRRGGRLTPESVSHIARDALDSAGLQNVRLRDLRYDYILRQYREKGWAYALSVAGASAAACRAALGIGNDSAPPAGPPDPAGDRVKLWRILQSDKGTPAGLALCLASELGLRAADMCALTWEDVDLRRGTLTLRDRSVLLTPAVRRALGDLRAARDDGDSRLFRNERNGAPMTPAWLGSLVRVCLARGGLEGRTLEDFRRDSLREEGEQRLLDYAARRGSVSRREAMELLGLSRNRANALLASLRGRGALVLLNSRYYPASQTPPPAEMPGAVRQFLAENGPAYRQAIVNLLHVAPRSAALLLRRMVEAGTLVMLPNRQYALREPEDGASAYEQA